MRLNTIGVDLRAVFVACQMASITENSHLTLIIDHIHGYCCLWMKYSLGYPTQSIKHLDALSNIYYKLMSLVLLLDKATDI